MQRRTEPLSLNSLEFATLEVDFSEHILTVTLNRPHRKNALNNTMINELVYVFEYAKQSRDVRVVVITGAGDVFCAGGDLKGMHGNADEPPTNVPILAERPGEPDEMVLRLYNLHKPVIAKIQGSVYAGALLMVCNATHAIAAVHAQFCAPEIRRGLWPFQVMAGLFNVMPQREGLDFIMRGLPIDAATAVKTGLINEAIAADQLDSRVSALASELAALAPGTMQMGLAAFRKQQTMVFEQALPYLKDQFFQCVESSDAKEGIAAFVEKRNPRW